VHVDGTKLSTKSSWDLSANIQTNAQREIGNQRIEPEKQVNDKPTNGGVQLFEKN
jgi:hypothetical protein